MHRREPPPPGFVALGLHDWLARSCAQLGMREPMPIQIACVPAILAGHDVIGRASTGSGKTAAFALPILQRLSEDPYGVYALVLTPTRELAVQIAEQTRALGELMRVRCEVVTGGADMIAQAAALSRRPHIVVGTPGRLLDHLRSGHADAAAVFGRLRALVLDEADRLLDLGFGPEIGALLERLPPSGQRQTLLFSATITASLRELQAIALRKPFVADARKLAAAAAKKAAAAAERADDGASESDDDDGGDGGDGGDGDDGEGAGEETVALPEGLSQFHLFVPLKVRPRARPADPQRGGGASRQHELARARSDARLSLQAAPAGSARDTSHLRADPDAPSVLSQVKDMYLAHVLRLLQAAPAGSVEGRGVIVFTSTCVSCELLTRWVLCSALVWCGVGWAGGVRACPSDPSRLSSRVLLSVGLGALLASWKCGWAMTEIGKWQ
jgi:hypothetical protein